MKYKVCYIDDQAHPRSIDANTAQMAAWRFVHLQPRTDTSQITVESQPSVPWRSPATTHYRACDLINQPAPPDEPELDLALRREAGPEPSFVVSGSIESLRALGTRLLQSLDEFPTRPNPFGLKNVYRVFVVPGDGSRLRHYLSFEADPDVQQYWKRQRGFRGIRRKYGRCLFLLIVTLLSCIGVWTLVRWLF